MIDGKWIDKGILDGDYTLAGPRPFESKHKTQHDFTYGFDGGRIFDVIFDYVRRGRHKTRGSGVR